MSEHKKKILEMLAQNKISADEAYRLLSVVDATPDAADNLGHDNSGLGDAGQRDTAVKTKPKYLRVTITPDPERHDDGPFHRRPDKVNVRIPMSLIRAGIKMKALIPPEAKDKINSALKEKGISFDMDSVKNEDIEELIEALGDMQIDIDGSHGEQVRVYVE